MVRRIELTHPILLGAVSDHEELESKDDNEKKDEIERWESFDTPMYIEESLLLSPPPMIRLTEKELKEDIATPPTVNGSVDSSDILQASPVNGPPTELLLPSFSSTESETASDGSPRSVILRERFQASPSSGLVIEERRMPIRIVLRPRMSQLTGIFTQKEDMNSDISLNYNLSPLLDMDLDDDSGQEETKEEESDDDMELRRRQAENNPQPTRVFMSSFSSEASFDMNVNQPKEKLQETKPAQPQPQVKSFPDHYEAFEQPNESKTFVDEWQEMFFSCFNCNAWTPSSRWPSQPQQSHWATQVGSHPSSTFTAEDFGVAIPSNDNQRRHAYI